MIRQAVVCAVLVSTFAAVSALNAGTVSSDARSDIIAASIESLVSGGSQTIAGERITSRVVLPEFYRKRRFRPAWRSEAVVEDLLHAVADTRADGFTRWPVNAENEMLALIDWCPSCDVFETEKEYRIRVELPGVLKEDVRVTLEKGLLTIQGERKDFYKEEQEIDKGIKHHRRELTYGDFVRRFTMPDNVDDSKVEALFKDGILDVIVYKAKVKPTMAKEVAIR